MPDTDISTKKSLDKLLHGYAMHVLKMGQIPAEENPDSFLEDVRERKRKILLKKKELASDIAKLFEKKKP